MNMPGFTGETSLYKTSGHYRAMAGTPNVLVAGALTLALLRARRMSGGSDVDVDCTDFPDDLTCRECGPWGELDCCALKRPNDICIIQERVLLG
jgi:hypothetical protein